MIRILVADDHVIIREGLKLIISEAPDMSVAAEAGTGVEALRLAGSGDYDLVLLDISMPDMCGLDVLRQLKVDSPAVPVLVLSTFPERQYAVRSIKHGASGYITKEEAAQSLVGAIREVAAGGRYITPRVAASFSDDLSRKSRPGALHASLSGREHQVMLALASGSKPAQIAQKLGLSPKTVSTYRARLLKKLGIHSNAELIHYAIRNNLVGL